MSKCPNCGNEVPENNKFCMRCGYKIEDTPKASSNLFTAAPSLDGSPSQPSTPPPQQDLEQPQQSYNPPQQDLEQPQDYTPQPDLSQPQQSYNPPQQDYNQPQDYYSQQHTYYGAPTQKKKWVLPAIIGACAVVLIAIVAVLVVLISKPTNHTPKGAVELAFQENIKKSEEYMKDVWKYAPDEAKQYQSEITKIFNYLTDSIKYKITDVDEDGNTATVTVEISMADFSVLTDEFDEEPNWDNKREAKQFLSAVLKALKSAEKITDTAEITLHKDGDEWKLDNSFGIFSPLTLNY